MSYSKYGKDVIVVDKRSHYIVCLLTRVTATVPVIEPVGPAFKTRELAFEYRDGYYDALHGITSGRSSEWYNNGLKKKSAKQLI